ncbi:MAG: tetratricopeptide repeat protein [Rhodocyclaceae bacterium]|nr:tetratricopeptide repeat protein [Rhodocyclaceae bacterium]
MMTFSPLHSLAFAASLLLMTAVHADPLQDIGKLIKQGQHAQALDQVDKYLSNRPKDAQGRFVRGVILTEMNKTGEAVAVFQKLTEDYPELPEPYNNLAVIHAQQKQYEKAKQSLEMAIRTHPSYATAHENLGDIYARMASQSYDKALQIDSSNSSAQTKLSIIRDLISVAARPVPRTDPSTPAKPVIAEPKPVAQVVEPKPLEPKVAEPVAPPKPVSSSSEVTKAVENWAASWSKKEVNSYLAHYAKDFQTPGGVSRATWEKERKQRIAKPGELRVDVENLHITTESSDKATATFRQHYRSAAFKTSSNKVLNLVKRDGKWLIKQERVGK